MVAILLWSRTVAGTPLPDFLFWADEFRVEIVNFWARRQDASRGRIYHAQARYWGTPPGPKS